MTYTDSRKRHDFLIVFDVTLGNPNGDPDADNLPRIDPETMHGIITDVCLKRKIRDYLAVVLKRPIFIQSKTALNKLILDGFRNVGYNPFEAQLTSEEAENETLIEWLNTKPDFEVVEVQEEVRDDKTEDEPTRTFKVVYGGEFGKVSKVKGQLLKDLDKGQAELKLALQELGKRLKKPGDEKKQKGIDRETQDKARSSLCADYDDIRLFGAVLSTGLNAGQVRGPLQLTFARSVDPVLPQTYTITRQARTTSARMESGQTEMGRKSAIPYGLYVARGYYNPFLAEETGVGNEDLKRFWEALTTMFEYDRSASRGEMVMHQVYIFTHENKKGNAHAHQLFRMVNEEIKMKTGITYPRAIEDYNPLPSKKDIEEKFKENDIKHITLTMLSN
ncbi:MAG: type I-C CRISPR-associated protein Cas7/Csd2 [Deltaproteobacteria bacterium]|nr:type I-C CRISPR-associated protein Cas7/Csd2 [Deltaproteobacteria bacterium]